MTDMIYYARDEENSGYVYTISQALKLCLDKMGKCTCRFDLFRSGGRKLGEC